MHIDFEVMVEDEVMGPADLARFFNKSASTIKTFIRRRKQENLPDDVILQKMFNEYGDKEKYEIEQPVEIPEISSDKNKRFIFEVEGKILTHPETAKWLGTTRRNLQYIIEEARREKIDDHVTLENILKRFNKPAWAAKLAIDENDVIIPEEIGGYSTASILEFTSKALQFIRFSDEKSDIYKTYLLLTKNREPLIKRLQNLITYWIAKKIPSHVAHNSTSYICDLMRELVAYLDMAKSLHAEYGVPDGIVTWFDDLFDTIENESDI